MNVPVADLPLVSFVIPCFNSAKYLPRALDSIVRERAESYPNLEIIVVDGGSTDGTRDILQRYGPQLSCWISEPDEGPGDAFNKGVRRANGDFIRYMAADDAVICGGTVGLVEYALENRSVAVTCGLARPFHVDRDGAFRELDECWHLGPVSKRTLSLWLARPIFTTEACLFRRSVFAEIGPWRAKYRLACDLDYWFLVVQGGSKIVVIDVMCVARFLVPESVSRRELSFHETLSVIREHAGPIFAFAVKFKCVTWLRWRAALEIPFRMLHLHPLRAIRAVRAFFTR